MHSLLSQLFPFYGIATDSSGPQRSVLRSEDNKEEGMCVELLQWAGIKNPTAALENARRNFVLLRKDEPSSLTENLMLIAESLDPLFETQMGSASFCRLIKSRSINGSSLRKHNTSLVLALVEESQMEHEAVVSLFHKTGLSLRDVPRNVLLCNSSTTRE